MIKRKSKLSVIEKKYCSCIVKVRGKKIQNPYAICTHSVYSSRGKKRSKVKCLNSINLKKLNKDQLKGLAKEKKLVYSRSSKKKIINNINKYLKVKL